LAMGVPRKQIARRRRDQASPGRPMRRWGEVIQVALEQQTMRVPHAQTRDPRPRMSATGSMDVMLNSICPT
jgi:hypothetical protein